MFKGRQDADPYATPIRLAVGEIHELPEYGFPVCFGTGDSWIAPTVYPINYFDKL